MKIERNKSNQIIVIALVILFVPFFSVYDCFMNDQILDSGDNHSFILNPFEGKIPDSISNFSLDPTSPLIAVTASQVFHPPAIV